MDLKNTNVYLSEDLTKEENSLFFQCRNLRKQGLINSTWTKTCQIFIKTQNNIQVCVNSEKDIAQFRAQFGPPNDAFIAPQTHQTAPPQTVPPQTVAHHTALP